MRAKSAHSSGYLPPVTVCLVGSTRFTYAYREANLRETLDGKIVLTIGCDTKSDEMLYLTLEDKTRLDVLHLCKIDKADEVLVLNVGGYVGESTRREIEYAMRLGKQLRWLEPPDDALLQLVANSSRRTPVHPILCVGLEDETYEQDLARAQEEAVFARFGQVVRVKPMAYGEVAELARRHTRPGETVCLLFDLEHPHLVDLCVDLALFVNEWTGKKPICIYLWKDATGEQGVTVKYPSPR